MQNTTRLLAGAGLLLAAAVAQADTFTFNGAVDNTWNEDGNWLNQDEQTGTPGSTDTAVIPSTEDVVTDAEDAECLILEIAWPASLKISEGSTFTLHGGTSPSRDSTINGFILFSTHDDSNVTPVFEIMNTTTIVGVSGNISGGTGGGFTKGVIRGDTSSTTLTTGTIGGGPGFALVGHLDVEIELVNETRVSTGAHTLTLKTNAKSGSGLWETTLSGTLNVDVAISGTGGIQIFSGTGEININADCPDFDGHIAALAGTINVNNQIATSGPLTIDGGTVVINNTTSMTGSVFVKNGTLTVNEEFCTTGDIHYTGGTITVAGGATPKSATFGGVCSTP